jgi:CDP-glycerol glycerophosphotransferase (TagB/SpsB family)
MMRGCIVDAGYPRNDLCVKTDAARIRKLLEKKIGGSLAERKVILYAPTFRSREGKSLNTAEEVTSYIREMMERLPEGYELFFKIHNTVGNFFRKDRGIRERLIFDEIETNELLSATDILITDYSSIFFDFLCTGRPCLFFVYDREQYVSERGLYLDIDTLPGPLCETVDQLVNAIETVEETVSAAKEKYEKYVKEFAYHDDGNASKRVVDLIFGRDASLTSYVVQPPEVKKKRMLINLGEVRDEANVQALLFMLDRINYDNYLVTVCCKGLSDLYRRCAEINKDIRLFSSEIVFNQTHLERILGRKEYTRQYEKYFPGLHFDVFICIDDLKSGLTELLVRQPRVYKTALINHTTLTAGFVSRHSNHFRFIHVMGEDHLGALFPQRDRVMLLSSMEIRAMRPKKLNILFISAFDSMNSAFTELIKELRRRGHNPIVVVKDQFDNINNKYYINNDIEFTSIKDFRTAVLNYVDIVVSAPAMFRAYKMLHKQIRERNIFMISFASLFSSIAMRSNPDVVLCIGETKIDEFRENHVKYNFIVAGNPQYDGLARMRRGQEDAPIHKVLVIDQGGYPFGAKGKKQLADTLVNIAKNNPDKLFHIKPRYTKDERGQTLHNVSEHLSDYLEDIPDNLYFIEIPTILEEIVTEYDAMICTWSTAYIDAMILNIPILVLEGFDSVDVFDVRTQRVEAAYEHLRKTGCLYHYKDVLDREAPFRLVDEEYLRREVFEAEYEVSPAIVDYMEYAKKHLVLPGLRYRDYIVSDIKSCIAEENPPNVTWKSIQDEDYPTIRTYRFEVNRFLQEAAFRNRCMGWVLDLSELDSLYEEAPDEPVADLSAYSKTLRSTFSERFQEIQSRYFTSEQGLRMIEKDKILQDFYFDWLYQTKQYDKILHYEGDLAAPESRAYAIALIELDKGHRMKAFGHLMSFIDQMFESEYDMQLLKQKRIGMSIKAFMRGINFVLFGLYFYKSKRYRVFEYFSGGAVSNSIAMTFFRMKDLNQRKQYALCVESYEQFVVREERRRNARKKRSIKYRIKRLMYLPLKSAIKKQFHIAEKELKEEKAE